MTKKMLTSSQLAECLGATKLTVLRMATTGQIPSIRIGTGQHYRFDLEQVMAALKTGGADQ
jgi:excisionase family DNA binding protein